MTKRRTKIILLVACMPAAAVVVAVIVLYVYLDTFVKIAIEKGGTAMLGAPTTLEKVKFSLWHGTLALDGLRVGSMPGFAAKQMFAMAHGEFKADIRSLLTQDIRIHEVTLNSPDITLEFSGTSTNWGTLKKKMAGQSTASKRRIRIDHMAMRNAHVSVTALPASADFSLTLPDLELHDIGNETGGGLPPQEMLARGVSWLADGLVAAATKAFSPAALKNLFGSVVEQGGKVLGKAGPTGEGAVQSVGTTVTGAVQGIFGGFGGQGGGAKKEAPKQGG